MINYCQEKDSDETTVPLCLNILLSFTTCLYLHVYLLSSPRCWGLSGLHFRECDWGHPEAVYGELGEVQSKTSLWGFLIQNILGGEGSFFKINQQKISNYSNIFWLSPLMGWVLF